MLVITIPDEIGEKRIVAKPSLVVYRDTHASHIIAWPFAVNGTL